MNSFVELFLTCEDQAEATVIPDSTGNPEKMDFRLRGNDKPHEAEVAKLHGYETFVLQAMPMSHISKAAAAWLAENTK